MFPHGVKIITDDLLTVGPFEDWSGVRSPGRARRRMRRGHRQNITYYRLPDPDLWRLPDGSFVGHPATVAKLQVELEA